MKLGEPRWAMAVSIVVAVATGCSEDAVAPVDSGQPSDAGQQGHQIDGSVQPDDCTLFYPAYEQRSCEDVDGVDLGALAPLPTTITAADEGDYLFCPAVPDCATLTPEEVCQLLCAYAAQQGYYPSMSMRYICGPNATAHGACCYYVDAHLVYQ